jgi:two-component system cell cycle response regulator
MARMLVIEDNSANLELMTYLLTAFGHIPLQASDGEQGLLAARRELPDLIVCDMQLPRLDGYAIMRQLKVWPETRAIPVIAVTALAMVGDRDRIIAQGFDGYISKPIVPETFVAQVENFLDPAHFKALELPSMPASASATVIPRARAHASILVVDDSPLNRELMNSILNPFGYTVLVAASVREALDLAHARAPDLIISDLHMPAQDGFDLIRAIKADTQLRAIKIIIHSATVMSEKDCRAALDLGALKFLMRPVDPQAILAAVDECLEV